MKRLIVTADDFGMSLAVNEAVENAHRHGILSAASLMVAGDAAADAIARARRLPNLGVGLHLVLVDGKPLSPPEQLPDLVDRTGRFPNTLATLGTRLYFNAAARYQAEIETRAQLAAFGDTGLPLDHVNAHHHFHFHPVVRDILIRLAPQFGIRAIRIPREPAWLTWRACGDRVAARITNQAMLGRFTAQLKTRLDSAGIAHNDWQLGLSDTGAMTAERTMKLLMRLPDGVTELYSHPAQGNAEHQALIDAGVVTLLEERHIQPIPFAALGQAQF
ncbi:MAG TPA: hopanoid biosynthesis-associated protein HpnK [Stellaceae bacterium]|nr:hopanoid biosynthesis-associated protein HpnK [Stellaceae bacterium]